MDGLVSPGIIIVNDEAYIHAEGLVDYCNDKAATDANYLELADDIANLVLAAADADD